MPKQGSAAVCIALTVMFAVVGCHTQSTPDAVGPSTTRSAESALLTPIPGPGRSVHGTAGVSRTATSGPANITATTSQTRPYLYPPMGTPVQVPVSQPVSISTVPHAGTPMPAVTWDATGTHIIISTTGSRECPNAAVDFSVEDYQRLLVDSKRLRVGQSAGKTPDMSTGQPNLHEGHSGSGWNYVRHPGTCLVVQQLSGRRRAGTQAHRANHPLMPLLRRR